MGGWYHVTARGNERKTIFRDEADRRHFLEVIAEIVPRFRVRLHCFVLMDNHDHLLLELSEPNLSRAVQWLNVSVTASGSTGAADAAAICSKSGSSRWRSTGTNGGWP